MGGTISSGGGSLTSGGGASGAGVGAGPGDGGGGDGSGVGTVGVSGGTLCALIGFTSPAIRWGWIEGFMAGCRFAAESRRSGMQR
jgi:hypothetical protein